MENNSFPKQRIDVVDALRGLALMAIVFFHFLEHYNYWLGPGEPTALDKGVWNAVEFIFSGKAYSIFALLFGFTFSVQMANQAKKGIDFGYRYLWRLATLLIFGFINATIYNGDILVLFVITGTLLFPVRHLSNKYILIIAGILLLQPLNLYHTIRLALNDAYVMPKEWSGYLFTQMNEVIREGSMIGTLKANFTLGQLACNGWCWDVGRASQTPALFMLGFLLGRNRKFDATPANFNFWAKIFVAGFIGSFVLYLVKSSAKMIADEQLSHAFGNLVTMWYNIAFTMIIISVFVMMYQTDFFKKLTSPLRIYGKMSLTNYIMQSLIGTVLFYEYGFALGTKLGSAASFALAIVVCVFQVLVSKWWMGRHKQGPLEGLWHKLTYIEFKRKA